MPTRHGNNQARHKSAEHPVWPENGQIAILKQALYFGTEARSSALPSQD